MAALITSKNKPSVIKVTGKVRITISGRMNAFTSPSRNAAMNKLNQLSTTIPGIIDAANPRLNAEMTSLFKNSKMNLQTRLINL